MRGVGRRVLPALAALTCLLGPVTPWARPFTVNDLLHQESFGAQALDPSGHWWVVERRDAYDTAQRFDLGLQDGVSRSRLLSVDLRHPDIARPLISNNPRGVVMAGFSPSGARLAVFRLQGRRWRLGVITLRDRTVRWFPITPDIPDFGRTLQWRSDRELLVIDRPDHSLPWPLEEGHASVDRLPTLWVEAAAGGGRPTIAGSGRYVADHPRPAGRRLVGLDPTTGHAQTLATGALTDLEISPDGENVALLEDGEDLQPRHDGPAQGAWGLGTHRSQLSILSLSARTRRTACGGCDVLPLLLSWSPSGGALLVFTRSYPGPWADGVLRRITPDGRQSSVLSDDLRPEVALRPEVVRAGWMGDDPVVLARPAADPSGRADYYRLTANGPINLTRGLPTAPGVLVTLNRHGLTVLADGALWGADENAAVARLAGPGLTATQLARPVDGRSALIPLAEAWLTSSVTPGTLFKVDQAGFSAGPLALLSGSRLGVTSDRAQAAVTSKVSAQGIESLTLVRAVGPSLTLTRINTGLAAVEAPSVIPVPHRGPGGQALTSWLYLPPEPAGAAPPPLIVRAYSGDVYSAPPHVLPGAGGLMTDVRTLVGHGYAVLVPSLPRTRGSTEPMAGIAAGILAAVDAAAASPASRGRFDPERLALWGHSYGGYTVMAAIAQTQRFRAAVSISGVSDLLSKWSSLPVARRVAPEQGSWSNWSTGNTESGQNAMGAPPWSVADRYLRNSPLLFADRITTPLLLIHGDQDFIPLAQSEAMFSALYRQNKDAELLTYWGEGHYISSPGHVRDVFARAFAFLDSNLSPTRKPAPAAPGGNPALGSANGAPKPQLSRPTGSLSLAAPR